MCSVEIHAQHQEGAKSPKYSAKRLSTIDCLFFIHLHSKQQPKRGWEQDPFHDAAARRSLTHHKSRDSQRKQIPKTWVLWIYKYTRQILNYPQTSFLFPEILLNSMNPTKSVLCLHTLLGLPEGHQHTGPDATRSWLQPQALCSLQQSPICQHHQKPSACLKCVTSSFYSFLLLWHLSHPEAYSWACCLARKHFTLLKGR